MSLIEWHRHHPLAPPSAANQYGRGFVSGALTENPARAAGIGNVSFALSDATITVDGEPSNRVLVNDGKINGTFPSGMGFGNYILDLVDPSDSLIYAGVTFNPTTLAENSWFLGVSGSGDFPESRIESATEGFLYWLLGFTYFDDGGNFVVWNDRLGSIHFAFTYGVTNGARGLLPIDTGPGWLDTDAIA